MKRFVASTCLLFSSWLSASEVIEDHHSFANTKELISTHLELDWNINFPHKTISGYVIHDIKKVGQNPVSKFIVDTRDLNISSVDIWEKGQWNETPFTLSKIHKALGQALNIDILPSTKRVKINYSTNPQASGLQWLSSTQTAGKKQPFLYSQAQAIHARSFIPLQDTPQVRVTYSANIKTPKALRAVMGAKNSPNAPLNGEFNFIMPQAIPSYLIAFAVGDIHFKAMGKRTGVYSELAYLDKAVAEFEDTEEMLIKTEQHFGPYTWGRYDLLILPPSFPFGGMENPRLSFITPTVLAGDKSLVSLIAHELAHSWSGNSVTNATWNDLWLNEGFTTYLTYRIMEIIYGKRRFEMESILGFQSLEKALIDVPKDQQTLAVNLKDQDPDLSFSNIPYEKGAFFLRHIENLIGRSNFDIFLKQYFQDHQFKSLNTALFINYLDTHLLQKYPKKISIKDINNWIYQDGLPINYKAPSSHIFTNIDKLRAQWLTYSLSTKKLNKHVTKSNWTVQEWLYFLNKLPKTLEENQLQDLDKTFLLSQSNNNEILHSWLLHAINNNYKPAYIRLEQYLLEIGRRKLIVPLYKALTATPEGNKLARIIYKKARPTYHGLAQGTIDNILNPIASD